MYEFKYLVMDRNVNSDWSYYKSTALKIHLKFLSDVTFESPCFLISKTGIIMDLQVCVCVCMCGRLRICNQIKQCMKPHSAVSGTDEVPHPHWHLSRESCTHTIHLGLKFFYLQKWSNTLFCVEMRSTCHNVYGIPDDA